MAKVKVEWRSAPVEVPALDRVINPGDELDMEEAEARDRETAGQVRRVAAESETVARATARAQKKEA